MALTDQQAVELLVLATIVFDPTIGKKGGEWVAPHPLGGEIFGATRDDCLARLTEAHRVVKEHLDKSPSDAHFITEGG